jgi:hypothetical protein
MMYGLGYLPFSISNNAGFTDTGVVSCCAFAVILSIEKKTKSNLMPRVLCMYFDFWGQIKGIK